MSALGAGPNLVLELRIWHTFQETVCILRGDTNKPGFFGSELVSVIWVS